LDAGKKRKRAAERTPERSPRTQQQTKKPWTSKEKAAVYQHLGDYPRTRKLPGKLAVENLFKAEPTVFKQRQWRNVKDFVRNQIRKKDPLSFIHNL